jgi:hypothetical protein
LAIRRERYLEGSFAEPVLALLHFEDVLLYRILTQEADDSNRTRLANAVHALHRLLIHCCIPPEIHHVHSRRSRKREPHASCLGTDEQYARPRRLLEGREHLPPLLQRHLPLQPRKCQAGARQGCTHLIQTPQKLRKHNGLDGPSAPPRRPAEPFATMATAPPVGLCTAFNRVLQVGDQRKNLGRGRHVPLATLTRSSTAPRPRLLLRQGILRLVGASCQRRLCFTGVKVLRPAPLGRGDIAATQSLGSPRYVILLAARMNYNPE